LPAGASVTADAKTDTLDFNNTKFVTLSFAASSAETDYDTANNQRADSLTIPETPSCFDDDSDYSTIKCFIATAAYGSALDPHVGALRQFRDQYLQRTALGRAFIHAYYRYSPPIAAVIAQHDWLRWLVRMLLTPLILTIEFPVRALLLTGLITVMLPAFKRRSMFAAYRTRQPSLRAR
jgi:hypothetical protein